jgi:hypothetical protein
MQAKTLPALWRLPPVGTGHRPHSATGLVIMGWGLGGAARALPHMRLPLKLFFDIQKKMELACDRR